MADKESNAAAQMQFAAYNVVAVFPDMAAARDAILALERAGIEAQEISLLGRRAQEAEAEAQTEVADRDAGVARDVTKAAAAGTAAGTAAGGALGFLAGALAFGIPGVGPVVGAGIWAATLGGAITGGSIGGLVGGTAALPQNEAWELTYESVKAGHVVVGVHSQEKADVDAAAQTLDSLAPLRLERFTAEGRRAGAG
ncbi:MAG TPA: low temperature-induced protein [Dehalococcoidia bacterium]